MSRRIAHISDLHFGRHDPLIVAGLVKDLRGRTPDLLVVSGDLTQRARRREFAQAREFLDHLALPTLVVPGNHDIPLYNLGRRFFGPLHRYGRHISTTRQPNFCDAELAVVGLDTARALVISGGRINRTQLGELQQLFAHMPQHRVRIVVTHHPLIPPPERPLMPLVGRAAEAAACFEQARVDVVLAGHFHDSYTADLKAHYDVIDRSILVIHAGTATSTRTRAAPNSYNLVEVEDHSITVCVRHWVIGAFEEVSRTSFHRTDQGWIRYAPAA